MKIDVINETPPPPKQYVITCSKDEFDLIYYSVFHAAIKNGGSTLLNDLFSAMKKAIGPYGQSYEIAKKFNLRDV